MIARPQPFSSVVEISDIQSLENKMAGLFMTLPLTIVLSIQLFLVLCVYRVRFFDPHRTFFRVREQYRRIDVDQFPNAYLHYRAVWRS